MQTKTKKEIIEYKGFIITVTASNTRFGPVYEAINNIGEPYTAQCAYTVRQKAIDKEKENIDKYLDSFEKTTPF